MGGEDQSRLLVICDLYVAVDLLAGNDNSADPVGIGGVPVPDAVELRELGAEATEVVPYAAQNGLDFSGGFFRKSANKIGAADFVLWQERTKPTHERACDIGECIRRK